MYVNPAAAELDEIAQDIQKTDAINNLTEALAQYHAQNNSR